jgi:hypothetical protein
MSATRTTFVLAALSFFMLIAATIPAHAQTAVAAPTAPDSTLYTTYNIYGSSGAYTLDWTVCGSTQESEGCYASGSLGPFVAIGAMMEGLPMVSGSVVSRLIYVVDSGSTAVKLYVYKKVDTVSTESDSVTVTLTHTITLPLTGGSTAITSMAANTAFLFIGTNQSPQAVEVRKATLAVTKLGGFSPPINVTSITADQYGYVTVTQGDATGESGFYLFGPSGGGEEDGGGASFTLGTMQAIQPTAAITGNAATLPRLGYHLKAEADAK